MAKFSFDYDSTLSRTAIKKMAKKLIAEGHEIHVVTSRFEDTLKYADQKMAMSFNRDLFRVTDHLGIKRENIHFMNMVDKYTFFLENPGFLIHLDDDPMEILDINANTPVIGIVCDYKGKWLPDFSSVLEENGL